MRSTAVSIADNATLPQIGIGIILDTRMTGLFVLFKMVKSRYH
jgi:hypothetical protein